MNTWIKVARYQLAGRHKFLNWAVLGQHNLLTLPWVVLTFGFALGWVIIAAEGTHSSYPSSVGWIFLVFFVVGVSSVTRALPFGLALGLSRRSYYVGTVLLAVTLAALDGLPLAGLQAIERATGGWGHGIYAFRVPYLLDDSWYVTWLTSFVVLTLVFLYGLWYGLVYRRWNVTGLVVFIGAQMTAFAVGFLVVMWTHASTGFHDFFATLTPAGFTGVLAVLAAVLLAGGFATMRRVSV